MSKASLTPCGLGLGADVVAVVEGDGTAGLERQHGAHVVGHGCHRAANVVVRVGAPQVGGRLERQAGRHVAVERVVGGGLVGHRVEALSPAHELRLHLRGVADEGDGLRSPGRGGVASPGEGLVEVVTHAVDVARLEAAAHALGVHLDAEGHAVVHGHRQRLRAAHAAEAGGEHDAPAQGAPEVLARQLREGLVRALQDALAADVDPGAGGHLAVHREAGPLELAEGLPGRPAAHQVAVGDEHARCPFVGAEDGHRLARGHQERLVVSQGAQLPHDGVEGGP